MKRYKILAIAVIIPLFSFGQENEETSTQDVKKFERAAFEGTSLIESQTTVAHDKKTLEMVMNHRFGLVDAGPKSNDLIGIWGPANIRIAFSYAIHDRLTLGYGTTKDNRLQDFNWKATLLRQTKGKGMPVNVSYYGNFTNDARRKENFTHTEDRYSFFNQLLISRRINRLISLQVAPSVSHYNLVESHMENDVFALSAGGRVKVSPQASILLEYTQMLHSYKHSTPKPGVSVGVEFATGSHSFQIFITNYKGIVAQKNIMYNQNDFFEADFMIGFNIIRLWHL